MCEGATQERESSHFVALLLIESTSRQPSSASGGRGNRTSGRLQNEHTCVKPALGLIPETATKGFQEAQRLCDTQAPLRQPVNC